MLRALAKAEYAVIESEGDRSFREVAEEQYKKLTTEQHKEFDKVFDLYDADHSGLIEPEELVAVFRQLHLEASVADVEALVERFDFDKNGTLDVDEFKMMMAVTNLARSCDNAAE